MSQNLCAECGKKLWGRRIDSRYCSNACKQKAYRLRQRPDWGHGPNLPKLTFTEDEIQAVLDRHYPIPDTQYGDYPLCSCSTKVGLAGYTDWTSDHFIEVLKENRYGNQAPLHPNFAQRGEGHPSPTG